MATIDFEFTKQDTAGGAQTRGKFQYDIKGAAVTYETLREAEAAFQRWFRAFHSSQNFVDWTATEGHRGILAKYSSALPYGFPKDEQ